MTRPCFASPRLAFALILAALAAPASASPPETPHGVPTAARPQTLEELMRTMATTPGVVAEFTETKHIALLEEPLRTTGKLYFIPPNRMARYTTAPSRSSLIIDGDRLHFEDESGSDGVDLAGNPVARTFVDNFIVLFNGDLAELQRRYEAEFAIEGEKWSLRLVPRSATLSRLIEAVIMRGDDRGMRSMTLRETGGDVTETVFTELDTEHHFTPAEIAAAFRTGEPAAPAPPATP